MVDCQAELNRAAVFVAPAVNDQDFYQLLHYFDYSRAGYRSGAQRVKKTHLPAHAGGWLSCHGRYQSRLDSDTAVRQACER